MRFDECISEDQLVVVIEQAFANRAANEIALKECSGCQVLKAAISIFKTGNGRFCGKGDSIRGCCRKSQCSEVNYPRVVRLVDFTKQIARQFVVLCLCGGQQLVLESLVCPRRHSIVLHIRRSRQPLGTNENTRASYRVFTRRVKQIWCYGTNLFLGCTPGIPMHQINRWLIPSLAHQIDRWCARCLVRRPAPCLLPTLGPGPMVSGRYGSLKPLDKAPGEFASLNRPGSSFAGPPSLPTLLGSVGNHTSLSDRDDSSVA